jgi:glycosyltransferase involved in cell wall biosynthesis
MPYKIAIVHDSLTEFGGAERVLLSLIKIFPQADLFTSLVTPKLKKIIRKHSEKQLIYSQLSKLNIALKYPSYFKPYFYHYYWRKLNLDKYDLVISSSHSFCANLVNVKNKHLSYIYTPPRFLYEQFNEMNWLRHPIIKKIADPYFAYLRQKDKKQIQKIDLIIADSKNVQKRIKKYYNRNAQVIYPPVKLPTKIIKSSKNKRTHYLFFSRLVKQKGIELVIKAFNQNQKPLLVVGTSQQAQKWQKMAKANIKFLGFVSDQKMPDIFAQSKALVYASINEDFGMVPVEAMSHGLPVIAYQDGGVKETIVDQKTGLFFRKYDKKALNEAIDRFEKMKLSKRDCLKQAQKFSENQFVKKITKASTSLLKKK